MNFSEHLYLLNGNSKCLIASFPAFFADTKHMAFGEKIKIFSNGNILIFSNHSEFKLELKFAPRIISGSTGKILPIARNDQFIEKLGIIEDKIYFLLDDGTLGIQNINIDEDEDEPKSIPDYKSAIYEFSAAFNIIETISNTVEFIDHPVRWEAECAASFEDRSDDGTYIFSTTDGRVLCLKLYRGAKRITCDELADGRDDSRTR